MALNTRKFLFDIAEGRKKAEEEKQSEQYATQADAYSREQLLQSVANQLNTAERAASIGVGTMLKQLAVDREAYYADLTAKREAEQKLQNYDRRYADAMMDTRSRMQEDMGLKNHTWTMQDAQAFEKQVYESEAAKKHANLLNKQRSGVKDKYDYDNLIARIGEAETKAPGLLAEQEAGKNAKTTRYTVVNPFQSADTLREQREKLEQKYQSYSEDPSMAERGRVNREAVAELNRRIEMIEKPESALEEVTARIDMLKRMQNESGGYYNGLGLDIDIEDLERQQRLLQNYIDSRQERQPDTKTTSMLALTAGEKGVPAAKVSTLEDWLERYDVEQLSDIESFLPEGYSLENYRVDGSWNTGLASHTRDAIEYIMLTDEERRAYDRMDESGQKQFMDDMRIELNERIAERQAENTAAIAKKNPVLAELAATGAEVLKPLGSAYAMVQGLTGGDIDPNSMWLNPERMQRTIRETNKESIENAIESPFWGKAATFGYDVTTGALDNATRMLAFGGLGSKGTTAMMGLGTIGGGAADAAEGGANSRQALAKATIDAAVEVATEYLPIERMFDTVQNAGKVGAVKALKSLAASMTEEAVGESLSTFLNAVADKAVLGERSDYNANVQLYMMRGMSHEEATRQVFMDILREAGYSGAVGAVSGGLMQGGAQIAGGINRRAAESAVRQAQQEQAQKEPAAETTPPAAETQTAQGLWDIAEELYPVQEKQPSTQVTVQKPAEVERVETAEQKAMEAAQTAKAKAKRRKAAVEAADSETGYTISQDGTEVHLEDLDAESADAKMLNEAQDMNADAVNDMLTLYEEGGEIAPDQYAKGYEMAYKAGMEGKTLEDAKGLYMDDLTDTQRQSAWLEGKKARSQQTARVDRQTRMIADKHRLTAKAEKNHKGVSLEQVTKDLTNQQTMLLRLIDQVGKKYGVDVRVYDTLKGGQANAYMEKGTNVMSLALDAQDGALTRVASHELYHFVEGFAKEDAKQIRAFVLEKLRSTEGYDLDGSIEEIKERYARNGVNDVDAESEIVADSMLDIIATEENLTALAGENRTLLQKIKNHVQELLQYVRQTLQRVSGHSEEVRALMNDAGYLQEIVNRMNAALENARKNYEAQNQITNMAMENGMVQAYEKALRKAKNAEDRNAARESLVQNLMYATQENAINESGNLDGTLEAFKNTLQRFANGEGQLDVLLRNAGLDSIADNKTRAAVAFAARTMGQVEAGKTYSIDARYASDIKDWDERGRKDNEVFVLGSTGDVLQGLGAIENDIFIRSEKINTIMNDHPEMTMDVITKIPQVLEDPVLILKSKNVGRAGSANTRMVVFGSIKAENGQPVMAVLDLRPVEGKLVVDDMQKVNSAYTKTADPESFVRNSEVLYTDKKRTIPLLRSIGFKMPIELQRNGYVGSISYNQRSVNIDGVPFDEMTAGKSFSLKTDMQTDYFMEIASDEDVREANQLIAQLIDSRQKLGTEKDAWRGKTSNIAKKILEETGSQYAQGALTGRINKAYEAIDRAGSDRSAIMAYCYDIGRKVAEKAGEIVETDPARQQARDYLRTTRIYLNEEMQSEVKATYGSVAAFMRRNFGKAKFTTQKNATGLEEMWSELHDMLPSVFKEDTALSEMPFIAEAFLESSGKINRVYYNASEEQIAQDVAMRLFWEYFQMLGTYTDLRAQEQEMVQRLSDTMDSLRDTFEQRVQERIDARDERAEKVRQRTMLERTMKQLTRKLNKPTKENHIPEQYRGAVAEALKIVNTGGNKKGQEARTARYNALLGQLSELKKSDEAMLHIDPDMEAHIKELRDKTAGKSIMAMSSKELKQVNSVLRNLQHACAVNDRILTDGRNAYVGIMAEGFHVNMERAKDRKVKGNIGTTIENLGRGLQDAPRFFNELSRVGGEGARELWHIIRHGGLDTQIRLLEEAEGKMQEALGEYDYRKWYSEHSGNQSFETESGEIRLTKGQVMALYLLNKRDQARNHIYGVRGEDGGIAQGRVKVGANKYSESVRPSKVNEMQVKAITDTLTEEEKAAADKLGDILSGWCAELGNEVSMRMYGYRKFTEKNYFPIQVWDGRKSATTGEQFQNNLYQVMNKGFTKETQDKAQAPLVVPDIFDAVTEHINGMIVYRAWTEPVSDVIKFMNYKYTDDSVEMVDGRAIYVPGQNILGSTREDLERVLGKSASTYMTQLLQDINGLSKNSVEKKLDRAVGMMTRNFKSTAVAMNIGTIIKQPFSVTRAYDVIPAHYFVSAKPVVPTKKRAAIMNKYAPIYYWKQQGNFTMDTGKSIQNILMPKLSNLRENINELGMKGAGFADSMTWHSIWAAAERMTNAQIKKGAVGFAGLAVKSDAYYKKVAEIFNKCIDETQTVDSVLHRTELMRTDSAWVKSLTTFMGEPMKTMNMLMDAMDGWRKGEVQSKRRMGKTAATLGVSIVVSEFINSLVSALRKWDDEDPFWKQIMNYFIGEYEEEMTKGEKITEFFLGSNLGAGFNLMTYLPFARDLAETLSGYTVERVDMTLFSQLVKAFKQWNSESVGTVEKAKDVIAALGNMLGVPLGNIVNEGSRVWNYFNQQLEALGKDTLISQYIMLKTQKALGAKNLTDYATLILKAQSQGNTKIADEIRADLLEAGAEEKKLDKKLYELRVSELTGMSASDVSYEKTYGALAEAMKAGDAQLAEYLREALEGAGRTEAQINDGLKNYLKENDTRVIEAAKRLKAGDNTAYKNIFGVLRSEGFTDAVAKDAVNAAYNALQPKEETATADEDKNAYEGMYTSEMLKIAVEHGDTGSIGEIMDDLRKQGRTDSSLKSTLTSYFKPLYRQLMNGTASDRLAAEKIKKTLMSLDLKNKYTEEAIKKWLED